MQAVILESAAGCKLFWYQRSQNPLHNQLNIHMVVTPVLKILLIRHSKIVLLQEVLDEFHHLFEPEQCWVGHSDQKLKFLKCKHFLFDFFNNCLDWLLSIAILKQANAQPTQTVAILHLHHCKIITMEQTGLNFALLRDCSQYFYASGPISIAVDRLHPKYSVDASHADTLSKEKHDNIDIAWLK